MALPDPRPAFPDRRPGVAVLGCGAIARTAHLPAYRDHGVPVVGVWSRSGAPGIREEFPGIGRVYDSAEDLRADPAVEIVDLATPAAGRVDWIARCVAAGKHVLAQKPLVADAEELARLLPVLDEADDRGVSVAVNQNGRWAPPWRLASLLVRSGAIGEVVGVTHLHDKPLPPLVGTPFDDLEHMLVGDYLMHWIDITVGWLGSPVTRAAAWESRTPGQPADAKNPWSATVSLAAQSGATALLRVVGDVRASAGGCPFWIHGTTGTLRGSVLLGSDRLTLDRDGVLTDLPLHGQWFVDGFAGTMGELMSAIAAGREPENSARDVVGSVAVMLAATRSAHSGGVPAPVEAVAR